MSSHFSKRLNVTLHPTAKETHTSVHSEQILHEYCAGTLALSWVFLPFMFHAKHKYGRYAHLIKVDSTLLLQHQLLQTIRKVHQHPREIIWPDSCFLQAGEGNTPGTCLPAHRTPRSSTQRIRHLGTLIQEKKPFNKEIVSHSSASQGQPLGFVISLVGHSVGNHPQSFVLLWTVLQVESCFHSPDQTSSLEQDNLSYLKLFS